MCPTFPDQPEHTQQSHTPHHTMTLPTTPTDPDRPWSGSPTLFDTRLLELALATPPPPSPWSVPGPVGPGTALFLRWLLETGRITQAPPLPGTSTPRYTWTPEGRPPDTILLTRHPPTEQPMPSRNKTYRNGQTVLEWFIANTPPDQWWSLDKWIKTGERRLDGSEVKDYNQLRLKMSEAGISYNHAWTTLDRAYLQGILIKGDMGQFQGQYKWAPPSTEIAPQSVVDPEVNALAAKLRTMGRMKQRAVLMCAGISAEGGAFRKDGYTVTVEDLLYIGTDLVAKLSITHGTNWSRTAEARFDPTSEEMDKLTKKHEHHLPVHKVPTYNTLVPGDLSDYSPEELRAIEDNERENQMWATTELYSPEDIQNG